MNKEDLLKRLKDGEDRFVERKSQGINERELRKQLVAFSNTLIEDEIGLIFIGIADNGDIQGVPNTDKLEKSVRSAANDCYPPIANFTCDVLEAEKKSIVTVIIRASKNRPHFAGVAYIRQGSESIKASEKIFNELIDKRHNKCAVILAEKEKGNSVILRKHYRHYGTVSSRGMMSGQRQSVFEDYKIYEDCFIVECNAHFVRLMYGSTYMAESLDNITISYDEKKWKLLLISDSRV